MAVPIWTKRNFQVIKIEVEARTFLGSGLFFLGTPDFPVRTTGSGAGPGVSPKTAFGFFQS